MTAVLYSESVFKWPELNKLNSEASSLAHTQVSINCYASIDYLIPRRHASIL